MKILRVRVYCETSGRVREAFRAIGHDATSCDLLPADDGSPHHIQGDMRDHMDPTLDLAIMHPECTFVSGSGIHWNNRGRGWERTEAAVEFARWCMSQPMPWVLENPVGILSTRIRKPDQILQPYRFGDDASKQTCLWLHRLPALRELPMSEWVKPRWVCHACKHVSDDASARSWTGPKGFPLCHRCESTPRLLPRWANQTDSGQNRLGPSADRWKERSATYPGIARQMAAQLSDYLLKTNSSP
jgi:hypothetical protein